MKENSPICARLAERSMPCRPGSGRAARSRTPRATCRRRLRGGRPVSANGSLMTMEGSNNMPTETKNSTANASCSGSESSAARWLRSDSLRITPAKNAPSAKETSNRAADPYAIPSATASTESVKTSREPVRATFCSSHGTTRLPMSNATATNSATFASAMARMSHRLELRRRCLRGLPVVLPPNVSAKAGKSTSASTIARSSTTSQPTAMRPSAESSLRCCSSARSSTTVLATDRASPNVRPSEGSNPRSRPSARRPAVAVAICAMAPGNAMLRTARKSFIEKCRPTPNISRITPISASWRASPMSPTNPGVNGPITTPASR